MPEKAGQMQISKTIRKMLIGARAHTITLFFALVAFYLILHGVFSELFPHNNCILCSSQNCSGCGEREVRHNTLSYVAGLTQIVNGFVSCHNVIDMVARQPRSRITICDIDKLLAGKDIKNRTFPNDQKCQM